MAQTVANGRREATDGGASRHASTPRSLQIASQGLRTTQDMANFGSALASDVMAENVANKIASAACRALSMTFRAAEFQFRHGNGSAVTIANPDGRQEEVDPLAQREAELLEELETIRKERAAK